MTKQTWGLDASLYDYYQAITFREPEILKELRQATSQLPMANMQIAPEQGQFMALLVQLTGARKILEIGVFTGYSSLAMALALPPQGRVLGCEISAEYAAIARQFWQKAGVSEKIDVLLGPAVTSLEQLLANGEQESFDLAFIDANKRGRKSQSMTVPSITHISFVF
jgi:predicted O-methyltransferase YrrM